MPNFLRPVDLERLQFNQLRSKNITQAPWNIEQAAQNQIDGRPLPVMYLPGSTGQNKWKTPPRGYDRGFAATARQVAQLASVYARPAPKSMMEPVPFYRMEQAARPLNRLPRMDKTVSVQEPLSRGVLQRGDLGFTTPEYLRAVAQVRNDPPTGYGVQENISARMFPSTYVFTRNNRPRFIGR